jgi:hypothetical protein
MKKIKLVLNSVNDFYEIGELAMHLHQQNLPEGSLVAIHASGNLLEAYKNTANLFVNGNREEAIHSFSEIKKDFKNLLSNVKGENRQQLTDLLVETDWLLHGDFQRNVGYYEAQIPANAELAASFTIAILWQQQFPSVKWLDSRDIIKSTEHFPIANLLQDTSINAFDAIKKELSNSITVTQAVIASTMDTENTFLAHTPWKKIIKG